MDIKQAIANTREQIQDDLLCILDGLDQDLLDRTCQMIVDRNERFGSCSYHGEGAQIHHKFTQEGVIVEGVNNKKVFPITHGLWDQLADDGAMKA